MPAPFFLSEIADASAPIDGSLICTEARALRARVSVPVGSDAAAQSVPAHHTTVKGGNQTMAKKAAKGGKKKGGKKR